MRMSTMNIYLFYYVAYTFTLISFGVELNRKTDDSQVQKMLIPEFVST